MFDELFKVNQDEVFLWQGNHTIQLNHSLVECVVDYINYGMEPGHFVRACLENNLRQALFRADLESLSSIPAFYAWIYNRVPSCCHGSRDAVDKWVESGGIARQIK